LASIVFALGVALQRTKELGKVSFLSGFVSGLSFLPKYLGQLFDKSFGAMVGLALASGLLLVGTASFDSSKRILTSDPQARAIVDRWNLSPKAKFLTASGTSPEQKVYSLGPQDAKLQVVEFADFECSACQRLSPQLKILLKEFPNDIRLIFKNFPLGKDCNRNIQNDMHKHACKAARAARCAGEQGNDYFWKVHDELMGASSLDEDFFTDLPLLISGLSSSEFSSCLTSSKPMGVEDEVEEANKAKVTGTPSLYVNGKKISRLNASVVRELLGDLP